MRNTPISKDLRHTIWYLLDDIKCDYGHPRPAWLLARALETNVVRETLFEHLDVVMAPRDKE